MKLLDEKVYLEELRVAGCMTLTWMLKDLGWESVDWINLIQKMEKLWVLVKTVINNGVP